MNLTNLSFEVTPDDVANVLTAHGLEHDADEIHARLNHDDICEAALWGDDIGEQTTYAYQEIEKQLKDLDILGFEVESKYPTN